ncbi:hypothetical protein SKA34_19184 [Photobacterium sp. SKA34]|nr:hypothetical protein SKA34_19184 [Photobacterium sp. SKA34]
MSFSCLFGIFNAFSDYNAHGFIVTLFYCVIVIKKRPAV